MPKENNNLGEKIISWRVPEYEKHERDKKWYIGAFIIALLLLTYAFITLNFLFAMIIIVISIIIILNDGQKPMTVNFSITDEGVMIGKKFYDYDELKNFSVIYKPRRDIKNLYFEFKNPIKQRLSIPLITQDPLKIRKYLLRYLEEDLERTDPPLSENLAKLFKL